MLVCLSRHSSRLLHLCGAKYPSTTGNRIEVEQCLSQHHTENSGLNLCFGSNHFLLVGFPIHDEVMDVVRSAQQGGRLTTMWVLFTLLLNWEVRREHGAYVSPSMIYANSVPDQHSLSFSGQYAFTFLVLAHKHKIDKKMVFRPNELTQERKN